MKDAGTHEGTIEQIDRLFRERLYTNGEVPVDEKGRIRIDDWEMADDIQAKVAELWKTADTETLPQLGDLKGYSHEFHKLFGFEMPGIDYDNQADEMVWIDSLK